MLLYRKMRHHAHNFALEKTNIVFMDPITDLKHINAPEGVSLLMEHLWLRHRRGFKQRPNNIFIVDLPPLTEEEKQQLNSLSSDYSPEELYGAWI
ncbi:MAG: hypothetical protein K2G08_07150 [Paramuribaculum sp.]|nr:hypothetical protein [Paramuribaculum sp.]